MTTTPRISSVDARAWRIATWAAPFVIQVVLGMAVGISWLAGKAAWNVHGLGQYVIGLAATVFVSAAISVALFTRGSVRAQGVAISIVGSFLVTAIGATAYGFWIIGW